jgi:hypothetical protein
VCVSVCCHPLFSKPKALIYRSPPRSEVNISGLSSDQMVSFHTYDSFRHLRWSLLGSEPQ